MSKLILGSPRLEACDKIVDWPPAADGSPKGPRRRLDKWRLISLISLRNIDAATPLGGSLRSASRTLRKL